MAAISTLLVVVAVSMLVTRVATVILTATGMSREAARFQARSAFSTAGFTTRESETVVDHPIRRRVIGMLMLMGSAGLVAVVSTAILGLGKSGGGDRLWRVLELVLGLVVLVGLSRNKWLDQRLTKGISWVLRRYTGLPTRDIASLLDLDGDYSVQEMAVRDGDWVANRSLGALGLRDEGLVVLAVTRPGGRRVTAPTGDTLVRNGDVMVVYGHDDALSELDDRASGPHGELAHRHAVARQDQVEEAQRAADQPDLTARR
ncbi:MAG TPA: TrkA C-terminal domain-containing protein [Mycobacteriales bacterium]|nr:TrkA C-terminal domain-containing protein [Mycobacteriales bacterium]